MPSSIGNGKAGTLRERIARNQAERERAIAKIEEADWDDDDVTGEMWVEAVKAGAAIATEATGRHKAQPPSTPVPPSSVPQIAKGAAHVMREAKTWPPVVALGLIVLLIIVLVAWRVGVALH